MRQQVGRADLLPKLCVHTNVDFNQAGFLPAFLCGFESNRALLRGKEF